MRDRIYAIWNNEKLRPLIFAGIAFVFGFIYFASREMALRKDYSFANVVIAKRDILSGELINRLNTKIEKAPKLFLMPGAFPDNSMLKSKVAKVDIPKDSQITENMIYKSGEEGLSGLLPVGYQAVTIVVEKIWQKWLKPGDYVDLFEINDDETRELLKNVLVLAVGKKSKYKSIIKKDNSIFVSQSESSKNIMIAVPSSNVEKIINGQSNHKLKLSLRGVN